jgi:AcrR family transcriptional regulator
MLRFSHMATEPGLRERKKLQTRDTIRETAQRLFGDRGFDSVTVAEVARAAGVSEGTVFNYFPTKEDLFYGQMEAFEAELVSAVRDRPEGESVLKAFRRFVLERSERLASEEVADIVATAARVIAGSAALQAREREIWDSYTSALAAVIAEEARASDDPIVPLVVANALMGIQRALVEHVRASVLTGLHGPELLADVKSKWRGAFSRLERGLGDYAVKR